MHGWFSRKYDYDENEIVSMYQSGQSAYKIASALNLTPGVVYAVLEKYKIPRRSNKENSRIYTYDMDFLSSIDSEEKAYWLGFLYADGYVTSTNVPAVGLSLAIKDRGHVEKFRRALNASQPIREYTTTGGYTPGCRYCRLLLIGQQFYDNAVRQGILEHKTHVLAPPSIPEEFNRHFIRGYFDGDGSLTSYVNAYNTVTYTLKFTGTKALLNWINDQVEQNCGFRTKNLYKRRPTDVVVSLEFGSTKRTLAVAHWLYQNSHVYLDRKYQRYQDMVKLVAKSKEV